MNENKEVCQYSEKGDYGDKLADKIFFAITILTTIAAIFFFIMKMISIATWALIFAITFALIRLLIPAHSFEMKVWVVFIDIVLLVILVVMTKLF